MLVHDQQSEKARKAFILISLQYIITERCQLIICSDTFVFYHVNGINLSTRLMLSVATCSLHLQVSPIQTLIMLDSVI